ncbi:MAG: Ig-like domain-containing protein [Planctomycetia bacterium]|nr:Ig-like domain-containing protein [Planctomycetia bacterium]
MFVQRRRDLLTSGKRRGMGRHLETLERRMLLNAAPVATSDVFTMPAGFALERSTPALLANDTDADGNALHISTASTPTHGDLTWHANGSFEYAPDAGFVGVDSFTYQAHDGTTNSNTATVKIRVGDYQDVILEDGPLGYWRLNSPLPDTIAPDTSPNGLTGIYGYISTAANGAIAAETSGAGQFGVGSSYVYLAQPPSLLDLQNNFTIEAWVNSETLAGDGFIFTNSQHQNSQGFSLRRIGNKLDFATHSIKDYLSPVVFTSTNTWYHVAVTFDGSNDAQFFINGQSVGTVAGSVTPPKSTSTALIGYRTSQSDQWHGQLDEVAVYGRVLTAAEVAQHYAMGAVSVGKRPEATADFYQTAADESLSVTVPSLPTPRHSFSTGFDASVPNANLEDPNGAFALANGTMQQVVARRYARTVKSDYMTGDFTYEVDVDMTTTDARIMYVGVGDGVVNGQAYDEPINSINFRLHTVGHGGQIAIVFGNWTNGYVLGAIDQPGIHRVRMVKTGNALVAQVDGQYNGVFEADISYTITDLAATAPFLNNTNSNLFFGGDLPGAYDNLYVESSLAPGAVTGVLDNDLGVVAATKAVLAEGPAHGDVVLNSDGTFIYTPDPGFAGTDTFSYLADDGTNVSESALVTIEVNGPPNGVADEYFVDEDGYLDARGPLVQVAATGFNDATGLGADGTANSPYRLNALIGGQGATEHGWREAWNNTPANSNVVTNVVYEGDGALHIVPTSNTWRRWTEPQTSLVTVEQSLRFTPNSRTSIVILDGALGCNCEASGAAYFRMDSDGLIKVVDGVNVESTGITWTPDQWYQVTVQVDVPAKTWRIWLDDDEVATPDTLNFYGNPTQVDAVLYLTEISGSGAYIDAFQVTAGTPNAGVLNNDADPNNDSLVAVLLENVEHGELVLKSNGQFTYRPDEDYSGTDQFTYRAFDGRVYSAPITVTLNVLPVNDLPTANDDAYQLESDGTLSVNASEGVFTNDTDPDSLNVSAILVDQAGHGTVTLHADGSFAYQPSPGFALVDTFTYRVDDGEGLSNIATVTLNRALPQIAIGSHQLAANTAGQTVSIYVTGGVPVSGLNLFVQVGDGGPERVQLGLPAGKDGPAITNLNVKNNTIFVGVPDNPAIDYVIPQVASASLSIAQPGGTVAADGLLATITLDTTGLLGGVWDLKIKGVLPDLQGGPFDSDFAGMSIEIANGQLQIVPATITGRGIFYAGSQFGDTAATDKQALLPGQTATFANYTNYVDGINGVAVDMANVLGTPTLADFAFYVGNSNDTATWQPAPAPSLEFVVGGGANGADRAMLRWADGAIAGKWLMVRTKSNAHTGLAADDVFYFGNAIGESGDNPGNALVNATDVIGTRDNPHGPFNPAPMNDRFDFNRDRLVNATDLVIARDHPTSPLTALRLIAPTGALPPAPPLRRTPGRSDHSALTQSRSQALSTQDAEKHRRSRELAAIDAVFGAQEVSPTAILKRRALARRS